ncbi:UDP-glucose-glycoprotein glucosyltransferase [Amblyomma americanum]
MGISSALLLLCVWSVAVAVVECAPQKVISVTLDSKWSSTPFHLEASEFFAEESSDYFWRYVNDFQELDLAAFSNSTPKAQYETVLEVAARHLSAAKLALLKLSLSLRAHSPAVETFQQVRRRTCTVFPLSRETRGHCLGGHLPRLGFPLPGGTRWPFPVGKQSRQKPRDVED